MENSNEGVTYQRLSVNLIQKASGCLDEAVRISGYSKTDTVNRALQVYAFILRTVQGGGAVYVREGPGEDLTLIKFL